MEPAAHNAAAAFPAVDILGLRVHVVNRAELVPFIVQRARAPGAACVDYVNIHACNLAQRDREFAAAINRAEVVFCDGFGVKVGARILGVDLGERMTPPDWIDELLAAGAAAGLRFYALGDEPGVAEAFVAAARARHPAATFCGTHHGFFDMAGAEGNAVLEAVRAAQADVVITGMGMPRQELWADRHGRDLGRGVILATGALFRWYAGLEQRAPRWMTDHGLEWLARLACKPRAHFRRYVVGNTRFMARVVRQRLARGPGQGKD